MKKPSPPSSGLRRRSPLGPPARVAGGEGGGARLVLAGEQRAGGVDQPAAGLHPGGGGVEDRVLQRRVAGELLGRQPPLALGLAAPGAGARAGGVDEHEVADRLQRRAPRRRRGCGPRRRRGGRGRAGRPSGAGWRPRRAAGRGPAWRRPAPGSCRRRRRNSRARSSPAGRRPPRRPAGSRRPAARPCRRCRRGSRRRAAGCRVTRSACGASGCAGDLHAVAGEHHGGGVGVGLQGVDAQVDRGARLHRPQHRLEVRPERGGELVVQEVGIVEAHRLGRLGEDRGRGPRARSRSAGRGRSPRR